MASLTIRDLNKSFGSTAVLKGVNLEVIRGAGRTFGLREVDFARHDRRP
jgi:hypothetical protein